jgi:hypothetical protein
MWTAVVVVVRKPMRDDAFEERAQMEPGKRTWILLAVLAGCRQVAAMP